VPAETAADLVRHARVFVEKFALTFEERADLYTACAELLDAVASKQEASPEVLRRLGPAGLAFHEAAEQEAHDGAKVAAEYRAGVR
jgi:hypothetical protein